jgi:phosphomannomutase
MQFHTIYKHVKKMTSTNISIASLMKANGVRFGTSGLRGLVDEMSNELCYAYVMAFLQSVVGDIASDRRVVLGHDLRPSNPRIAAACAKAIINTGRDVVYAGALPTPALASYAYEHKLPAIVVTGSHIPFDRNGIKFYTSNGEISKSDELSIQQAVVELPATGFAIPDGLLTIDSTVREHYVSRYVNFFGNTSISGLRVAIYEHSSVARDILREILEALGVEVISIGRSEDFVPIDTEAVRLEDVEQAKQWAQQYSFDAIVSTDGDADRPLIGDEKGQWLRGDVVGILCAKFLSADGVVTPVSSSTLTEKSGWFKSIKRTKIGSPFVIEAMQSSELVDLNVVAGFEANGGFLLGSDIMQNGKTLKALPTRDAALPILALLGLSKQRACPLSELASSLPPRYTASDRLQNFPIEKSTTLISSLRNSPLLALKLMAAGSGAIVSVDNTDGFRVTFENGEIVHLRASGNAPELRCYAESDSQSRSNYLSYITLQCLK